MNPAIAKLTPWLFETLAGTLSENGIQFSAITVDTMTSWAQFFKNIQIGFIILLLLESSIFTQEYQSGTLVLTLTKGFERYKVVIAKSLMPVNSSALLNGVGEASLYWSSIAVTALLCVVFAVLSVMALSQKQLQEGTGDK